MSCFICHYLLPVGTIEQYSMLPLEALIFCINTKLWCVLFIGEIISSTSPPNKMVDLISKLLRKQIIEDWGNMFTNPNDLRHVPIKCSLLMEGQQILYRPGDLPHLYFTTIFFSTSHLLAINYYILRSDFVRNIYLLSFANVHLPNLMSQN